MSKNKYPASDEFIVWAQSLSGMLTKIKTKYGGIAALVEHSDWDENSTLYFQQLIKGLNRHLKKIDTELSNHIGEKHG